MIKESNCRDEVRAVAISIITEKGKNVFTVNEVISYLKNRGTNYSENTIRTHVTSRCCKNAPKNHGTRYEDFERISRGYYKVLGN
ncbi:DUF7669 domain-containing protein [Clostridium guangxiense]|uniref:DUF7669 domain-containing protein n=1 Tax=Clostridium guangxiense TaxID=1662055 RepID=UPI001E421111|nr:hypothetical protein [Clostridium guangxiense]MCD2347199.1 hypothetical protein [Clostridium guangxiense]